MHLHSLKVLATGESSRRVCSRSLSRENSQLPNSGGGRPPPAHLVLEPQISKTAFSPPIQLDLHQLAPLLLFLLGVLLLALLLLLVEVASPLAKQGKLSSLPSLVRRLLCSCSSSSPPEDSSAFFPPANPSVATQTVLWSSSRAASPKPGLDRANLSHQLYSQDTGRLVNY